MAKMIKILCAIILSASFAFGASATSVFANFDKNYASASNETKRNFHYELKQIYSNLASDTKTRTQALKRLVYSSKVLGFSNYSLYKSELEKLGEKADYKPTVQSSTKDNLSKADLEFLNSTKPQNSKKIDKSKPLILQSITTDKNSVKVKFNRDLDISEMKHFTMSDKNVFRYVLDFKARQNSSTTRFSGSFIDEIRASQYDPNTARIVLNNSSKFSPNIDILGNTLLISKNGANALKTPVSSAKENSQNDSEKNVASGTNKIYKSTKGKIIVIDPGHGGKDSGAIGNGLKEKNIVLATSKKLGSLLAKRGYKVLYTRSTDVFINLKSRTAYANKKKADMFISMHANAAPNAKQAPNFNGIETFFLSPAKSERSKNVAALENKGDMEDMNTFSQETFLNFLNREKIIASNKLAIDIQSYMLNSVQKTYKSKDGGVREAPFWVLVGATMPAVLVEMGYISHPSEGKNLGVSAYQDRIAQGIANGVDAYFQKNK